MLDKTLISNIEKVFFVDNDPFPNAIINNEVEEFSYFIQSLKYDNIGW